MRKNYIFLHKRKTIVKIYDNIIKIETSVILIFCEKFKKKERNRK